MKQYLAKEWAVSLKHFLECTIAHVQYDIEGTNLCPETMSHGRLLAIFSGLCVFFCVYV